MPKFTLKRDGERRGVLSGSPFDLSCPAQGSPIPSFRLVICFQLLSHFQSPSEAQPQNSHPTQKRLELSVAFLIHSVFAVQHRALPFQHLGLPAMIKHVSIEPVGGSAPKFPIESRTSDMRRSSRRTLSLSCPAQGSPSPSFRLIS